MFSYETKTTTTTTNEEERRGGSGQFAMQAALHSVREYALLPSAMSAARARLSLHGYVSGRAVFSEGADREQLDGPRMSMGSDTMARRGARPLLPSSLSYLLPEAMCSLWSRRDTARDQRQRNAVHGSQVNRSRVGAATR